MKYISLALVSLVLGISSVFAQTPPPPPPIRAPSKEVGKAKVYYLEKLDQTRVQTFSYILGTVQDIYEKKKEVVGMSLEYVVKGRKAIRPAFIYLSLTSYSPHPTKYSENHKITIYVDGKELVSESGLDRYVDLPFLRSSSESYAIPRISYSDFEKMAGSERVSIKIGATKIDLKQDDLQALKDLRSIMED